MEVLFLSMNILYIHQGFPGQYQHIVKALGKNKNIKQVALGIQPSNIDLGTDAQYLLYPLKRGNTDNIHPLALETESKAIRGEACTRAALQIKEMDFTQT